MYLPIITSIQLTNKYNTATTNINTTNIAAAASIIIVSNTTKIEKIGLGY